jgi:hypothetical protein
MGKETEQQTQEVLKQAIVHIDRSIAILDDIIKQSEMNVKLIRSWLDRQDFDK